MVKVRWRHADSWGSAAGPSLSRHSQGTLMGPSRGYSFSATSESQAHDHPPELRATWDAWKGPQLHGPHAGPAPGIRAMTSGFPSPFRAMPAHEPPNPLGTRAGAVLSAQLSPTFPVCSSCLPNVLSTFSGSLIVSEGTGMRALLKMCLFCRKGPQNT